MLDQEAIFYMRSRGISEKTAQNLLLQAFIDEIVDNVTTDNDYTKLLKNCIADKLGMEVNN
jgi:Fe-S cluster assembly scaffold protein SufB